LPPHWVNDRLVEINLFYQTTDIEAAWDFLEKYDVRYIVLGQLERLNYPADGLQKFPDYEGILWRLVYQDRDTEIYQVLESQPGVALVK
jgi:uncharacterized membrane protein